MKRRDFLNLVPVAAGAFAANAAPAYAQAPFADEKTGLKITGVRIVRTRPRNPLPPYTPSPDAWSTNDVEVASPMSIYPEYKAKRSLFLPEPGKVAGGTVEISTNKGLKGYGSGGPGAGYVIEEHLTKLLMNQDPLDVERPRKALGPDGDIMLDCWMAWTERYTVEIAQMLEPYRIYWMEECLPPYDYAGFGRLAAEIKSTRIVTGEHEYTRYGFRNLLE